MAEKDKQLVAARAAKKKARKVFGKLGCVTGVGLTRRKGKYVVRIMLDAPLESSKTAPDDIDGVPVETQVIGTVRKQSRSRS